MNEVLMSKPKRRVVRIWEFEHLDKFGNVIDRWENENSLADEGEEDVLDVYYRGATAPTTFYLALYNDTPVDTDGLADLTGEASGNGYARIEIERSGTGFPTLALDSGDFQLTSKTVTYTASGGSIGPVTYAVLTNVSSGTAGLLLNYVGLSTSRTLADGESMNATLKIKLA